MGFGCCLIRVIWDYIEEVMELLEFFFSVYFVVGFCVGVLVMEGYMSFCLLFFVIVYIDCFDDEGLVVEVDVYDCCWDVIFLMLCEK